MDECSDDPEWIGLVEKPNDAANGKDDSLFGGDHCKNAEQNPKEEQNKVDPKP